MIFFYQVSLKDGRVRSGGDLKWGYVLENLFKNIWGKIKGETHSLSKLRFCYQISLKDARVRSEVIRNGDTCCKICLIT
jgi:hypothetical protein